MEVKCFAPLNAAHGNAASSAGLRGQVPWRRDDYPAGTGWKNRGRDTVEGHPHAAQFGGKILAGDLAGDRWPAVEIPKLTASTTRHRPRRWNRR